MRKIWCTSLLWIFICPPSFIAQIVKSPVRLLAKNDSIAIRIIKILYPLKTDYYLISNEIDSVLFHSLNYRFDKEALIYEGFFIGNPIQLDGVGKKEIEIRHVFHDSKGREDMKTIYIVNIDTKQKMFVGRYQYDNYYKDRSGFSYKTSFDKDKNMILDYNKQQFSMEPDHKEGIYSLLNGKYVWVKSQYHYTRKVIASNDHLDFKVVQISRCENQISEYFAVFNNNSDSIKFQYDYSCIELTLHEPKDSCKITARQLDHKGRKEVILEYSDGGYDRNSSTLMIFNLDARKLIFRGDKSFFAMFNGEEFANCHGYRCDITIKNSGTIVVSYPPNGCMSPSLKNGVYKIQNGLYTWMGENK